MKAEIRAILNAARTSYNKELTILVAVESMPRDREKPQTIAVAMCDAR